MRLDDAEADAGLRFDFLLQVLGEVLEALSRDDREGVDVESAPALAVLVDAQPEAATDRLTAPSLGADVA